MDKETELISRPKNMSIPEYMTRRLYHTMMNPPRWWENLVKEAAERAEKEFAEKIYNLAREAAEMDVDDLYAALLYLYYEWRDSREDSDEKEE